MQVLKNAVLCGLLSLCAATAGAQNAPKGIVLPETFPAGSYVPHGYLDNPWHSTTMNNSGVIRSVPPVGFGFWAVPITPYYSRMNRLVNYVSLLRFSFNVEGKNIHTPEEFAACGLHSAYHTKNLTSFDWSADGVAMSSRWFLPGEHVLGCLLSLENSTDKPKTVTVHATHEYGYIASRWWGSSGVTSRHDAERDLISDKIWEYGDAFVAGTEDWKSTAFKTTADAATWNGWLEKNDLTTLPDRFANFYEGDSVLFSVQSYRITLAPGEKQEALFMLVRGTSELFALKNYETAQQTALPALRERLREDSLFYASMPQLYGDWPQSWKNGWVYDYETLRMTVRPPLGIFRHHWDGMQVYMPRAVLGETAIDMMALSYADPELAKEVLFGTFADAPMPNVPCVREDGSMNMTSSGGHDCGTSPVWGMPFSVIYSIYQRTGDREWITRLYPYMKTFIDWWLENRTDAEGWFHCNNSWESGQDGSKRFTFDGAGEGDVADFVRTVDVEAAMADAMRIMAELAPVTGNDGDREMWERMAEKRIGTTRQMFRDGWFRDMDGRSGKHIILDENHFDAMMLMPVAVGIATEEQLKEIKPKFEYFKQKAPVEWPSMMQFFSEAAWNCGMKPYIAETVTTVADRIYGRASGDVIRVHENIRMPHLPARLDYRIPGVSNEHWPVNYDRNYGGAESYGWGATLPTSMIRTLIGFRESKRENEFSITPNLSDTLIFSGKTFGIKNLHYRSLNIDCRIGYEKGRQTLTLQIDSEEPVSVTVRNAKGKIVGKSDAERSCRLVLRGARGDGYTVSYR